MAKATDMINTVAKNLQVGVGQSKYKAVGEADVLAAVKPIENQVGIYSYPHTRKVIEAYTATTKNEYNGKVTEKNSQFLRVETVYRFVNIDNPEQYIDITTYGDGVDPQDKAPGKAMTYSDKYALLKAYKIETGDDPDQNMSDEMKPIQNTAPKETIDKNKIDSIYAELKRTNVKDTQILKKYDLQNLKDMTMKQYIDCMRNFEATPTKEKVNLGLE